MTDTSSSQPDTIAALFLADPTTLDDTQLLSLITDLRRRRNAFASEEAAKALAPKRTKAVKGTTPPTLAAGGSLADVSLEDL